jgi:hypothetical protein
MMVQICIWFLFNPYPGCYFLLGFFLFSLRIPSGANTLTVLNPVRDCSENNPFFLSY